MSELPTNENSDPAYTDFLIPVIIVCVGIMLIAVACVTVWIMTI